MTYRVDAPGRDTAWHATEAEADAEVAGLRRAGVLAVAWEWGPCAASCGAVGDYSGEVAPGATREISGAQNGAQELGGSAA